MTSKSGAQQPAGLETARRPLARRLLRLLVVVGIPLLLLPTLLPRKVSARRASRASAALPHSAADSAKAREARIQRLVDQLRARLSIPNPVAVALVQENPLVVSVERAQGPDAGFVMSLEASFIEHLSEDELVAVVAHELGHVWIFTHHPYLHTEELANQIAMRVARRATLEGVYEKVWSRAGTRGSLVYLPVE